MAARAFEALWRPGTREPDLVPLAVDVKREGRAVTEQLQVLAHLSAPGASKP